jgi:hypothetical protein
VSSGPLFADWLPFGTPDGPAEAGRPSIDLITTGVGRDRGVGAECGSKQPRSTIPAAHLELPARFACDGQRRGDPRRLPTNCRMSSTMQSMPPTRRSRRRARRLRMPPIHSSSLPEESAGRRQTTKRRLV